MKYTPYAIGNDSEYLLSIIMKFIPLGETVFDRYSKT